MVTLSEQEIRSLVIVARLGYPPKQAHRVIRAILERHKIQWRAEKGATLPVPHAQIKLSRSKQSK